VVPLDVVWSHAGVNAHCVVVHVMPHQLHAPIVKADGQHRATWLCISPAASIPLDADNMAHTCSSSNRVLFTTDTYG
jgi:hypothetical protein